MQALIQRFFGTAQVATPGPNVAAATPATTVTVQHVPTFGRPLGQDPELLLPDQITPETLLSVFRQAYMDVETSPSGSLSVRVEGAGKVFVRIDTERKLLVFIQPYGLKEGATRSDKLELANRINDQVTLVRMAVSEDSNVLVADCFMAYDGVVTPRQMVEGVRRFAHVTHAAVVRMDTDDVVQ